ncbi:MAG TPA: SDR family oxidoreductase [Pirellulales bacterium]|jgi:3-oxoacyl-[acyl-carrier protein] reductase
MPTARAAPKVFLITGCASGIGKRLAERVAAAGHSLLATDVNSAGLAAVAPQTWALPRVVCHAFDVRDAIAWRAAVQLAVSHWGRLDVLLNVAGVVRPGNVHEITPEQLLVHLDVNAGGMMLGTQAAAQQMVAQRGGHIVNICSLAGVAPVPGIAGYTASKFAVRGFSLAVAHELRPHGVSVTCVCPDAVETPMLDQEMDYDDAALAFSSSRPLTVDEVADAVLDRALARRPLEILLPRRRGWLAKFASLAPNCERWLIGPLTRSGRKRQVAYRERKQSTYGDRG